MVGREASEVCRQVQAIISLSGETNEHERTASDSPATTTYPGCIAAAEYLVDFGEDDGVSAALKASLEDMASEMRALLQEVLDFSNLSSLAYLRKHPHAKHTRKDLNGRIQLLLNKTQEVAA